MKNNYRLVVEKQGHARGDVAIYMAMLMLIVITSSAMILSNLLAQQHRFSEEIVASERAFYAANSGVEHALYLLVQTNQAGGGQDPIAIEGEVPYGEELALYQTAAQLVVSKDLTTATPCLKSTGNFRDQIRRLILRPPDVDCLGAI